MEDAPGILTPSRAATLLKAIVDAAGDLTVEIHCHNTTGLAPVNYIEAIKQGVHTVHTASRSLANGASLPSTELTVDNLDWLGHTHHLDTDTFAPVADHFERVAILEGFELGVPAEYSVANYAHHLPGGMTGTSRPLWRTIGWRAAWSNSCGRSLRSARTWARLSHSLFTVHGHPGRAQHQDRRAL